MTEANIEVGASVFNNITKKVIFYNNKKEEVTMEAVNAIDKKEFSDDAVKKVTYVKTDQVAQDTYYFKAGQVLAYHKHPEGDQVFFVHEGTGTFYLDAGTEETVALAPGCVILAPKDVWHKVVAETELIISQATCQPAGLEQRD